LHGVVAGKLYIYASDARVRRWPNGIEITGKRNTGMTNTPVSAALGLIRYAKRIDDTVRATFSNRASLNAAFGYYRKLSPIPTESLKARITVPVVVFAGLDDPIVEPSDYQCAARMFDNEYIVEEVRGGHFMHREHPKRSPSGSWLICNSLGSSAIGAALRVARNVVV
jgi:pimeloyl-ACP methyl ester carboxylesterase